MVPTRKMPDLPAHPDQITPDWLTQALSARFPGVQVAEVAADPVQQGTNSNARLRVRYAEPAGAPGRIFVKLPPQPALQRDLVKRSGMGRREVGFYARLFRDVPMRVPDAYHAAFDEADGSFVMLIEDLDASGCTFPDGIAGVSLDYATQAVDDLAALHARFFRAGGRDPALNWVEPPIRMREYGAGMLAYTLDKYPERLTEGFAEVARLYVEHTDAVHDAWDAGPASIVHGDGHAANLFDDGGRPGFLDWGLFSWGPVLRDVSYFLCMSLPVEDRREHERALLERYLARMEDGGAKVASPDEAWETHRLHAAYTVPAAAPAVIPGSSRAPELDEYSRAFVARANAAVADLDAPAALRSALGQ